MSRKRKILIIGANGQLGVEVALELAVRYGSESVITSDKVPLVTHSCIHHPKKSWT